MPNRRGTHTVDRPIDPDAYELPDGRVLEPDVEFSVTGESGRFRYCYQWEPDGSITAWGPVNNNGSQDAQWRSFPPERVRTIHRLKKERT